MLHHIRSAETGGNADTSSEALQSLLQIKPKRIVYISCNPETQVRDVRVLQKGGYKVEKCEGYDMFPHTFHIENIILMNSK